MELTILLGIVLVIWWAWSNATRKKAELTNEEMWDLRFPTLVAEQEPGDTFSAETFVDFEEMQLATELDDYSYHHVRVYHLRRSDGPVWELKEEYESWRRRLADLQESRASLGRGVEDDLNQHKLGPRWEKIDDAAKLEVAYQRFVVGYRPVAWPRTRFELALERMRRRDPKNKS